MDVAGFVVAALSLVVSGVAIVTAYKASNRATAANERMAVANEALVRLEQARDEAAYRSKWEVVQIGRSQWALTNITGEPALDVEAKGQRLSIVHQELTWDRVGDGETRLVLAAGAMGVDRKIEIVWKRQNGEPQLFRTTLA
jgi:hypothetical protein